MFMPSMHLRTENDNGPADGKHLKGAGAIFAFCLVCGLVITMPGWGCATVQRDYRVAPPGEPSSKMEAEAGEALGRWVDLEGAVSAAASSAGIAVVGSDRWELAVIYSLRTDTDQEGSLLVTGSAATGVTGAEVRIGRFSDAAREAGFLDALRRELERMKSIERFPDAH